MPDLHVLRVFCARDGSGGNLLGVVLDGPAVVPAERQAAAATIGFSETVFVDDRSRGEVRIFTPALELEFAGHPMVGTAWLLAAEGSPVDTLRPPAGEVAARADADGAYVVAHDGWSRSYNWRELGSPAEVDALGGPPEDEDGMAAVWAWISRATGAVRARVFPVALGIEEDEATGFAAVQLAAKIGRDIEIQQGRGSIIEARPQGDGWVEIGGGVIHDQVRPVPASSGTRTRHG